MEPFLPFGATVAVAAGVATAATALTAPDASRWASVRIASPAANPIIFVTIGIAGVTAAVATSMPILPGTVEVFKLSVGTGAYIAAITSSGSGTLYCTTGLGN